jgi:Ca-activated chloride channel family protein
LPVADSRLPLKKPLVEISCCHILINDNRFTGFAQYYLRGEVKDEKQNALSNAKILLHSTRYVYYSGSSGSFGILSTKQADSVTITLEGYQPVCLALECRQIPGRQSLKMLYSSANVQQNRLVSFTRNLRPEDRLNWTIVRETYSSLLENDFVGCPQIPRNWLRYPYR